MIDWLRDAGGIRQAERDALEMMVDQSADNRTEVDRATMPILAGSCGICGRQAGFRINGTDSNCLREGLQCLDCRCNARQRAAAMVLLESLPDPMRAKVHATEQASHLYVALRRWLPHLRGSEFQPRWLQRLRFSLWLARHGVFEPVRREDVTRLGFDGASLDAVLSLDVLEHVPDHRLALREFARVLKPGGALVLTVPFYDDRDASSIIASCNEDGSVSHVGEPEYHGDPISGGVLCFHHFGWDLLDAMHMAGFREARAVRVFAPRQGLPQGQWVMHATR